MQPYHAPPDPEEVTITQQIPQKLFKLKGVKIRMGKWNENLILISKCCTEQKIPIKKSQV